MMAALPDHTEVMIIDNKSQNNLRNWFRGCTTEAPAIPETRPLVGSDFLPTKEFVGAVPQIGAHTVAGVTPLPHGRHVLASYSFDISPQRLRPIYT